MSGFALGALGTADLIPGLDVIAIPLTIGLLAVTAVAALHAHQASQGALSDQAPATPCASCADEIPCFNTPEGADPAEMKRQLKEQQDKINQQSPEEMQKRLDDADKRKGSFGSYRPDGDAQARAAARESFQEERQTELKEKFLGQGLGDKEASQAAASQTATEMADLDATHGLDSIAGGARGDDLSLANKSVNRSIGAQWKSRIGALKDAVKKSAARGDKKMDVKLEPCDGGPTS